MTMRAVLALIVALCLCAPAVAQVGTTSTPTQIGAVSAGGILYYNGTTLTSAGTIQSFVNGSSGVGVNENGAGIVINPAIPNFAGGLAITPTGNNAGEPYIELDGYGIGKNPFIELSMSRGTASSPTAPQSTDLLGAFFADTNDTALTGQVADGAGGLFVTAAENFSNSHFATAVCLRSIDTVSEVLHERLCADGAGNTHVKNGNLLIDGVTSGTTTVQATGTASGTLTLPAATDTLVGRATTDTLTNKTLTDPINQETHVVGQGAAGNFSVTASTTLATIGGLDQAFTAAGYYSCSGHLHFTTAPTGSNGLKIALVGDGTVSVSALQFTANALTSAGAVAAYGTASALGSNAIASTVAMADVFLSASVKINAGGTIHVQAAENAASGTIAVNDGNGRWDCHRAA